jgi:hypothetical protein
MSRPIVGSSQDPRLRRGAHKRADTIGGTAWIVEVIAQIETFCRGLRKCVRANPLPT